MKVEHLEMKYNDTVALSDICFEVKAPSKLAIIGHNGSGKTTLLEILMGIKKPTKGHVERDGKERDEFKEKLGVILQDNAFYENIKVIELLRLFSSYYKDTYEIDQLIDLLGISAFKNKYYSKLSGGMRQKVNLALAFINKPEYVLLDEPTTGLDPIARKEFWEMLEKFCSNTLLMLSSHYMEEIQQNCSQVLYLSNGRLIFFGDIKELLEREKETSLVDVYLKISGGIDNVI